MQNKTKRLVKRETYCSFSSNWHCKEMGQFIKVLAGFPSGIGRKTLKGALSLKHNRRSKEGHLVICYTFPMEASESEMLAARDAWNASNAAKGNTNATYTFLSKDGHPMRRVLALHLLDWDLEPLEQEIKEAV